MLEADNPTTTEPAAGVTQDPGSVPPATSPPPAAPPVRNVAAPTKPGQWSVPKPASTCSISGRQIVPGEKFWTAVRETPEGIERIDFAPECWERADQTGLLASWQTAMPKTEEKKRQFVDDEVLCTLFEKLSEATEPAKVNFRFVLGLILMRKRLVLYDQTKRDADGRDVWVVRMRGRTDLLELVDPKLTAEQTLEVSQQLGQVLNEEM